MARADRERSKKGRHRRGEAEQSSRLLGWASFLIALVTGLIIVGPAPAHQTIDDISPNPGLLILGQPTDVTVTLTSESSCLEAESDPGIDVEFTPACGSGAWSSTMTVSDNGGPVPTLFVLVKEVDSGGSEIDSEVWDFIHVAGTTIVPSPTSTTPTTTPPSTSPPSTSPPTSPLPSTSPSTTSPPTTSLPTTSLPTTGPTTTSVPVSTTQPKSLTPAEIRDQFIGAGIAFNTPKTLELGETTTIQLLLSPSVSSEELEGEITAPGSTETADIETTCATTAELGGTAFEILPLTPLTQTVCAGVTAEWQWEIKALEEGAQQLTLVLTAEIDNEPPSSVETFNRVIEIQVGLVDRVFGPIVENLSVALTAFLAALGAAVGTWIWKRFGRGGTKGESGD